jgi:hypothetical protein
MAKDQISIRINPETLQKIDELAAIEKRSRNNMLEVLVSEALEARIAALNVPLFEHLELLSDKNLTGTELKLEIERAKEAAENAERKLAEYARLLQAQNGK